MFIVREPIVHNMYDYEDPVEKQLLTAVERAKAEFDGATPENRDPSPTYRPRLHNWVFLAIADTRAAPVAVCVTAEIDCKLCSPLLAKARKN